MGSFILISILYGINVLITTYFLCQKKEREYKTSKIVTSIIFVLLGIMALFLTDGELTARIAPALLLCLLGDILLAVGGEAENQLKKLPFWSGILCFLLAHLIFASRFLELIEENKIFVGIAAVAVIVITWMTTLSKKFNYGEHKLPCLIYSVFIGYMCASGFNLMMKAESNPKFLVLGIGAVLFMVSDLLLSMKMFSVTEPKGIRMFNLPVYYLAVYLIICGTI